MRLSEARRDHYRKLAKDEGYSSRASYKLLQIEQKYNLLKPSYSVIDFGCAPGGWLEVASKQVGNDGLVVGIDKRPLNINLDNVRTLAADVFDSSLEDKVVLILGKRADAVLSDLSPNISGVWEVDLAKQLDLCNRVVELLPKVLTNGGSLVMKVFEGPHFKDFMKQLQEKFGYVAIVKPPASRSASSELYLVCKKYLPW